MWYLITSGKEPNVSWKIVTQDEKVIAKGEAPTFILASNAAEKHWKHNATNEVLQIARFG